MYIYVGGMCLGRVFHPMSLLHQKPKFQVSEGFFSC